MIGHWMDTQHPKDVFLFEQGGAYVVRLHVAGQAGSHHELAEFTQDDIEHLVTRGPGACRVPASAARADRGRDRPARPTRLPDGAARRGVAPVTPRAARGTIASDIAARRRPR